MDYNAARSQDATGTVGAAVQNHHFGDAHGSNSPPFSTPLFNRDGSLSIDQSNGQDDMPKAHSTTSHLPLPPSSSPGLREENAPGNRQKAHGMYGDPYRGSMTPSTPPRNLSPRFNGLSPRNQNPVDPTFVPDDRSLPPRTVTDETLDEAYCAFILYCNPSFPLATDLIELKRVFRAMPKSDGNAFSTWTLFELIRKFEQKEIKTWHQLALELGVEPPSVEKGQSTQKVQQYSVRLKRWMRALHIDAFFEYLLGKQHPYFMLVPSLHAPYPENGRDGVPLEEDLALRALDPKFRPKRGRRKLEDAEGEGERGSTPDPKRPHVDTATEFDVSATFVHSQKAYPQTSASSNGHQEGTDGFTHTSGIWAAESVSRQSKIAPPLGRLLTSGSAITTPSGDHLNWRLSGHDNNHSSPYPMSAITPTIPRGLDDAFDEPRSAITPSSGKLRSRRRHGPAVSSAWSSSGGAAIGRLRGRPPSNRSVRDGPYVTFPANPKGKENPTVDMYRSTPTATPAVERSSDNAEEQYRHFRFPPDTNHRHDVVSEAQNTSGQQARPGRLQLQVPQRVGGPVHLITPTVLVNGQSDPNSDAVYENSGPPRRTSPYTFEESSTEDGADNEAEQNSNPASLPMRRTINGHAQSKNEMPALTHEDLKRALAADLIRADIVGRRRLRGPEAKNLAESIIKRIRSQSDVLDRSSQTLFLMNCASWLGLSHSLGIGIGSLGGEKRLAVHRYRVENDGYEVPVEEEDMITNADNVKEVYDISWSLSLGGLSGEFHIKGVELAASDRDSRGTAGEEPDDDPSLIASFDPDGNWQKKYIALRGQLKQKDEELQRLKDKVLEVVL